MRLSLRMCKFNLEWAFLFNENLDPKIGAIDAALNKLQMVLDSLRRAVMQVNKTVHEVSVEMEDIRKKLIVEDNTLHLLDQLKDLEGIKSRLHEISQLFLIKLERNLPFPSLRRWSMC
ncbi:hypothetical protein AMTRI_Chr03g44760 [Amborella trichopoda]